MSVPFSNDTPHLAPPDGEDAPAPEAQATVAAPRKLRVNRRVALLAATIYMPLVLFGYVLYLKSPLDCVAGPLCGFDSWPGIGQFSMLALGFIILYFVGVRPLAGLLDDHEPTRSGVVEVVRQAARFDTIRPLLAIFGGVAALALVIGLFARTLTLPPFVLGAGIAGLLFWLAAVGDG